MNVKQIRESMATVQSELDATTNLVASENRSMNEEETTKFDKNLDKYESLNKDLERATKMEEIRAKQAANVTPVSTEPTKEDKEKDKMVRDFSFGAAVRAAYDKNSLSGVEKELHQEGELEMSRIGKSSNGVVIPSMILNRAAVLENSTTGTQAQSFVQGVYANTILGDLGVTTLSTTTNQTIPIIPTVTTQWEGEADAAADGGSAMTKKDMSPKRLASYLDYSRQAAMQHNESLESALRTAIQSAIAAKVEYAIFTDDSPNGAYQWIANGKTAINDSDATTAFLDVVEEVISNNFNKGNLGFAISADLFTELHTAAKISGVNPLVVEDMIMGKPARFSSQIADITNPAFYYGDWSKLQIANFGGIEILADPYTQAVSGKNRLVLNSYFDAVLVQDGAISVGTVGA